MLIKCNKIISPTTLEDLGEKSPWLEKNKTYIVLALDYSSKSGFEACIQTDHYNEPHYISLNGFEVISQKIPSSWVTVIKESEDETFIAMLPKNWNYDDFFGDLENEVSDAVDLFHREAEKIYFEENE